MQSDRIQSRNMAGAWALIVMLACAAVGCSGGETRAARIAKGEAIINIGANTRTLDPSKASDNASAMAILALTRGLTSLDENGKTQPELAEN